MADFKEALEAAAKSYFVCAAHSPGMRVLAMHERESHKNEPASLFRSGK